MSVNGSTAALSAAIQAIIISGLTIRQRLCNLKTFAENASARARNVLETIHLFLLVHSQM